jgi:hypothetical protein
MAFMANLTPPLQSGGRGLPMPRYRMFQHKTRPGLRCIVAAAQPLPKALAAHMWEEEAANLDEQSAPPGFREGTARYALAVQGFYILR